MLENIILQYNNKRKREQQSKKLKKESGKSNV